MATEITQYGFKMDQCEVTRIAGHKGYQILQIQTNKQVLDIVVTPSGLIRSSLSKVR